MAQPAGPDEAHPLQRWLVIARQRLEPRDDLIERGGSLSPDAWEERYRASFEGFDVSPGNAQGAFWGIAAVPDCAALEAMLDAYPRLAWVDVETRRLPDLAPARRRKLGAIAGELTKVHQRLRAMAPGDCHEARRQPAHFRRYHRLLARARAVDRSHPLVAALLFVLGSDYGEVDGSQEREAVARDLLAIHQEVLGPEDRALIAGWQSVAGAISAAAGHGRARSPEVRERLKEAERCQLRALRLAERLLPEEHWSGIGLPDVRSVLYGLAQLYERHGQPRRAEQTFLRIIRIAERSAKEEGHIPGPFPSLNVVLLQLAALYERSRRYSEAEAIYRRRMALSGASPTDRGGRAFRVFHSLLPLAHVVARQGRHQEAADLFAQALAAQDAMSRSVAARADARHERPPGMFAAIVAQQRVDLLTRRAEQLRKAGRLDAAERDARVALHALDQASAEAPEGHALSLDIGRGTALAELASVLRASGRRGEERRVRAMARTLQASIDAQRQVIQERTAAQLRARRATRARRGNA